MSESPIFCPACKQAFRIAGTINIKTLRCPSCQAWMSPQVSTGDNVGAQGATPPPADANGAPERVPKLRLKAAIESVPAPGATCPQCQARMESEAILCVQCGYRVDGGRPAVVNRRRGVGRVVSGIVMLMLLAAGLAGWWWGQQVDAAANQAAVRQSLAAIIIPELDWHDATLGETLAFLNTVLQRDAPKGCPVGTIQTAPARKGTFPLPSVVVTLQARRMAMDQALDVLAAVTGCRWEARGGGVLLQPVAGARSPRETERFWGWVGATNLWWLDPDGISNVTARTCLGCCYLEGRDGPVDLTQAVELLLAGAEAEDSLAQYCLGRYYRTAGGDTNLPAALFWLERASMSGHPDAAACLTGLKKELAEAAYATFGSRAPGVAPAAGTDLAAVAKAVARMNDRTLFPNTKECEALLEACQRLLEGDVPPDLLRAVLGSRLLFEYERGMLQRGYQRRGGVFMDAESIARADDRNRQRMAEIAAWQKQHAVEVYRPEDYMWKPVVKRVPASLRGPNSGGGSRGGPTWEYRTVYVRVPVKRDNGVSDARARPPVVRPQAWTGAVATASTEGADIEPTVPPVDADATWMRKTFAGRVRRVP